VFELEHSDSLQQTQIFPVQRTLSQTMTSAQLQEQPFTCAHHAFYCVTTACHKTYIFKYHENTYLQSRKPLNICNYNPEYPNCVGIIYNSVRSPQKITMHSHNYINSRICQLGHLEVPHKHIEFSF